ncbi:MAG: (Fe-S)-binding protein [Syntrophaceae bacterium]|nr:(Fe-S)-binding protein [Syntrophaceae bacterium]
MKQEELKTLLYDEIAKCNRCGFCLAVCPVYTVKGREWATPRGKNALIRAIIENKIDWTPEIEETLFRCTGCRLCTQTCFPAVETNQGVLAGRECLVDRRQYPKVVDRVVEALEKNFNISGESNQSRSMWVEGLGEVPDHKFQKERAEVIYFVGCVAAFYPMAHKIPQTFVRILDRAGVDFTILGGEEWCCGFPLIQAGMKEKMGKLVEHNEQKVKEVGAKAVVFACPSCYHTWKERYHTDAELLHSTQFMERLIEEKKIAFNNGIERKVTYHDPCDLGRNSGVYDPPRNILRKIPNLHLVELEGNRQLSVCCGGGGDLEMIDPELSAAIAQRKVEEIQRTGADEVVTSCQQCIRTISGYARKHKIKIRVKDITEVVWEAMVK